MFIIGNGSIDAETVHKVAFLKEKLALSSTAKLRVRKTRKSIEKVILNKEIVYGVNTGFGAFKNTVIQQEQVKELQENLIKSHAVGVGNPLDEEIVRAIIFIIANYLSKGYSGVRSIVIGTLLEMLNKGVIPVVPEKGSVGSSGDLAPSAHIMLVLIGKGEAFYKGKKMDGKIAMKKAGIKPITLEAKEGLALINNTSTMSSIGSLTLYKAKKIINIADVAAALSAEALKATRKAYDKRIHEIKPHQGQITVAERMRKLLEKSTMIDDSKTQDQYSIICVPQIHGAIREAIKYVESIITTEINSVTDNPLIFNNNDGSVSVISGGNFHGEPVAIAMDTLGIALSEIANISDRRIASLLDPATNNGLPAFLTPDGGVNSGMMILQYTTAALASENKVLAHPSSVDSIPTSANVEDLVSMGTIGARKANEILRNVENVIEIEFLVACQAIDFRLKQGYKLGKGTHKAYKKIREVVPFFKTDTIYYPYFDKIKNVLDLL
jgi:histidine ammonia-lyase